MLHTSSLAQRRRKFVAPLSLPTKVVPLGLSKSGDELSKHAVSFSEALGQTVCEGSSNKWLGAYAPIEKIAEGTTAVVYRAERLADKQDVAVKFVRSDDEELLENARHEFELLQSLQHPCIVKAFDFIITPIGSALVLDYLPGCNLKTAVRNALCGRFEESIAQVIFVKLAHAVEYMHRQNIIHRDIKADNVLVSSELNNVCLVDFNIAAHANDGLLTVTGTISYMPPEVLLGDSPSSAGDIWALGLCLYLMLFGKLIIERQVCTSRSELAHELLSVALPAKLASRIAKDISHECKEVLRRCLWADPQTRATAPELIGGKWTQTKGL